jgi:osmotically-inducible protein OsmY
LQEIAALMQRNQVKRVPVVRDGKVIGIVSRANLLQGLLAREPYPATPLAGDDDVRIAVWRALGTHHWANGVSNVVVDSGVVNLWGYVDSGAAKEAIRVAAENVAGVQRVVNNVVVTPRPMEGGV